MIPYPLKPFRFVVFLEIQHRRGSNFERCIQALTRRADAEHAQRATQLREVLRYVWWNAVRVLGRRWKRYGRAAVVIGEPLSLAAWLERQDRETGGLFDTERSERLARVQSLADTVLERIAVIVPVTPVPLACAAVQSFDSDFISREQLLARMSDMRDVLRELNARVVHREGSIEEVLDRAWRMLHMRRILVKVGTGYAVPPGQRPLVSYYANSVAHLLGPFAEGVRKRDALPGQLFPTGS